MSLKTKRVPIQIHSSFFYYCIRDFQNRNKPAATFVASVQHDGVQNSIAYELAGATKML